MIAISLIRSLLLSLFITELFELPIAFLLGIRDKKNLALVFLINLITNPLLVMILNGILLFTGMYPAWYLIAFLEIAVVVLEYLMFDYYLKPCKVPMPVFSFLINLSSYSGGVLYETIALH